MFVAAARNGSRVGKARAQRLGFSFGFALRLHGVRAVLFRSRGSTFFLTLPVLTVSSERPNVDEFLYGWKRRRDRPAWPKVASWMLSSLVPPAPTPSRFESVGASSVESALSTWPKLTSAAWFLVSRRVSARVVRMPRSSI